MVSGAVRTPFLTAVDPAADEVVSPDPAYEVYELPLRYDEDTLLCAPVADETPVTDVAAFPDTLVPPVLRTAVIPDEAVARVAVLPRLTPVLTLLWTDVEDPLLTVDVPDTEVEEPFLDAYVLLTLEPDEVRCP